MKVKNGTMSLENAKEFMKKDTEDAALKERLAGKEPGVFLAVAKELGLECTQAELEEILKKRELTLDELDADGGCIYMHSGPSTPTDEEKKHCHNDLKAPLHNWVYSHHEERPLAGFIPWATNGFDVYKCTLCQGTKEIHT